MYNTLDLPESERGDSCYEVNEKEKAFELLQKEEKEQAQRNLKGKKKGKK